MLKKQTHSVKRWTRTKKYKPTLKIRDIYAPVLAKKYALCIWVFRNRNDDHEEIQNTLKLLGPNTFKSIYKIDRWNNASLTHIRLRKEEDLAIFALCHKSDIWKVGRYVSHSSQKTDFVVSDDLEQQQAEVIVLETPSGELPNEPLMVLASE